MEQQNPSAQNNQSHTHANTTQSNGQNSSSQNHYQGQQRSGGQNMRPQQQSRPNQERKPGQDNRNPNRDRNNRPNDRNQGTERTQMSSNDRNRGQKDSRYPQKPRDQKGGERPKENAPAQRVPQSSSTVPGHGSNNQNRPMRTPPHHGESLIKQIKPKRIETVEDIQADIERVEKDIQLEIKQIRAIKLGL